MEKQLFTDSSDILMEGLFPSEQAPESPETPETPEVPTPETPEVPQEPEKPINEDDEFAGYNEYALTAKYLAEEGLLDIDEIDKNLESSKFAELIKTQREKEVQSLRETVEKESGEFINYIKMKMNNIPDEIIEDAASTFSFAHVELKSDEDKVAVIARDLELKGLPMDDIKNVIEVIKNNGKLDIRAKESQEFFKTKEAEYTESILRAEQERERQEVENREKIRAEIDSMFKTLTIGDTKLEPEEARKLKDFISVPSLVVERVDPETGQRIPAKITPYAKMAHELRNNLVMQMKFAKWLMSGAEIRSAKPTSRIIERLNKKVTVPVQNFKPTEFDNQIITELLSQ